MSDQRAVIVAIAVAAAMLLGGAAYYMTRREIVAPHHGGAPDGTSPSASGPSTPGTPVATTTHGGQPSNPAVPKHAPPPQPPSPPPLTRDEIASLDQELAKAEQASVKELIDGLFAEMEKGRPTRTRFLAGLLAWRLAKDPGGLAEVLARMRERDQTPPRVRALLTIVGGVGTKESRTALLDLLRAADLARFEEFVLEALFQAPMATRDALGNLYAPLIHGPKEGGSTNEVLGTRAPCFDDEVLRATFERFRKGGAGIVSRAGGLLVLVFSSPEAPARMTAAVRGEMTKGLLDALRGAQDEATLAWAAYTLRWVEEPEVRSALWEAYRGAATESSRTSLAMAIAGQADSVERVREVISAIRDEKFGDARRALVTGLPREWSDAAARQGAAEAIAEWARQEQDEDLRTEGVLAIGPTLPEGAASLEWAMHDLSPKVRAAAEDLMRRR